MISLPPFFWRYMFTANSSVTRSKDPYQIWSLVLNFSDTIRFSLPILLKKKPHMIKNKMNCELLTELKCSFLVKFGPN